MRISGFIAGLTCAAVSAPVQAQLYFTPAERDSVQAFWNQPGRYQVLPPNSANESGSWRVRQTAEGSKWIWTYNRAIRPGKINPAVDPKAVNSQQAKWDAWIDKRVDLDYWKAARDADANNAKERGGKSTFKTPMPPDPGQMPAELKKIAGPPPSFASAVRPQMHQISFEDNVRLSYEDNVQIRPKYAYFRFNEGVRSSGERVKEMADSELQSLFSAAGISSTEMRVMKAVSLLEGGFDSINTYDTGYVSVGFIQFAALGEGGGSLGEVLLRMKNRWPQAFKEDFHRYGLEVTDKALLVALCPTTGAEFIGTDAALKIITDKRLAAVFQRAGQKSREFRLAQLQIAKEMYYPSEDVVKVRMSGGTKSIKVKDIFRTEAGMATMMDRKVNTGSLGDLPNLASNIAQEYALNDVDELANFEYDLVRQLKYRKDYLSDLTLSRPRADASAASRNGKRTTRGK